jgi:hypothetical protein
MNIQFVYGQVLPFASLPFNSVALDGAVQGPAVAPAERRYSFDHHGGCVRMLTLATCQQVATALRLGLLVDEDTSIYINDLDADTCLSVWLLRKAVSGEADALLRRPDVVALIEQVGLTDAHGPLFAPHPLHSLLGPSWGDKRPQDLAMLMSYLVVLDRWLETGEVPAAPAARPGRGYALRQGGRGWEEVTSRDGFTSLYEDGYLAVALATPAAEGSTMWTVAKRSDLVPLALGPADRSSDRSGAYTDSLLGRLASAEAELGCPAALNWGGGSSIGGSPRLPGGVGSRLPEAQVLSILNRHLLG